MAPVVYLPGFTAEQAFNMDMKAAPELARETSIPSPSPHAAKTPMVLYPQTPEPMDPDFAFFFPMQPPEDAIRPMGQHHEVVLPLQAPQGKFMESSFGVDGCSAAHSNFMESTSTVGTYSAPHSEIMESNFSTDSYSSEGEEFGVSQVVDIANFSFGATDYEDTSQQATDNKELMHQTGQCKPCAWFWKEGGCKNGFSCGYCHLCPAGELKKRKKEKVVLMRSGALEPQKHSERPGTGAGRQLRLDPLVSSMDV